jgi:hypothetical protein
MIALLFLMIAELSLLFSRKISQSLPRCGALRALGNWVDGWMIVVFEYEC